MINPNLLYRESLFFTLSEKVRNKLRRLFKNSKILQWFFRYDRTELNLFDSSRFISNLVGILTRLPKVVLSPLTYLNLDLGFILLAVSLTLSPKISMLLGVSSDRVPLYISDILVLIILIVFLIKIAEKKQRLVGSSLDIPIMVYLSIAIISTMRGMIIGTIDEPIIALLYLFKRIEYFLIFYLILNHIKTKRQIRLYLVSWFIACAFISIYGIYEHLNPIGYTSRLYRIYERGYFFGQATHFSGYLVFFMCISISLMLYAKKMINKFYFAGLTALMFPPFLWTYSRQSYLALIGALGSLCILKNKKLLIAFLIILLMSPFIFPNQVITRMQTLVEEFKSTSITHSTIACRLYNWRIALNSFPKYPLLGVGLGARHRAFYDNHYILVWSELGLLGLFSFLWLLLSIFKQGLHLFWLQKDRLLKAISLGVLAGFVGITIQGIASVSFIITRIAGPFWFLLGMVVAASGKLKDY